MTGIVIQLAPRAGPNVVYGVDASDPRRFVIRGSYLRLRLLIGLVILFFACGSQLDALRSEEAWSFAGATTVACLAAATAFVRRRLVLDRARAEVREEFAILTPFARRVRDLRHFRHVVVSLEKRPATHGHETVYPVDLQAPKTRIRVDAVGRWEHAAPLSEALARFLDLPVRDIRRGGDVAVEDLDAPLRDADGAPAIVPAPQPMSCRVTMDRRTLLKVEIPRPAVPQTLFLNGILLAFCVLPLLIEIVIPMARGFRPESLREAFLSVGWLLLPALLVGGGSIIHVARNGGSLSVTPDAVRFRRHGVLWRPEVVIPAESLEDLVILEPEMGGSRSLLAYFSSGVLVVRSDAASFRAGYGLSVPELEWLRDRIREVIGETRGQRVTPAVSAARAQPPEASGPVFPRWSRLWLGMLGGGILGRSIGGPFGVCVALPYLEDLLNVGAVVGLLVAAAITPSLWRDGASRRLLSAIVIVLVVGTFFGIAGRAEFVQLAARDAPGTSLIEPPPRSEPATSWSADRQRIGFFPFGVLASALLLNALLLIAFHAKGGEWRLDPTLLVTEGLRSAQRFEGRGPPPVATALVTAVLLLTGFAWPGWLATAVRLAGRVPSAERPARDGIRTPSQGTSTRPPGDAAGPPSRSGGGSSRLAIPPALPAVVPSIETVTDIDSVLASLSGRPALLLYWSGDETRHWLPDADRLHRAFAAHGLEVIGVPRTPDEAHLRETLGAARIGWRQVLGASVWRSRIPTAWPQVVLLDAGGEIVYRDRPGPKVEEALERLVGSPSRPLVDPQGVVEGRLVYAGRPLHEASDQSVRFWFRDEWTGREAQLQTERDPATSGFRFVGPIGTYLVSVSSGPRLDGPPHVSWSGSSTFAVTRGDPRREDIALQRILRLRQPVDNAKTLPPHPQMLAHVSPVRFAWDPLPEASLYRYTLRREDDRSSGPIAGETASPVVEFALSAGTYHLRLTAHGPSGLVGRLETYGENYRAWDYSFTAK